MNDVSAETCLENWKGAVFNTPSVFMTMNTINLKAGSQYTQPLMRHSRKAVTGIELSLFLYKIM